MILILIGTHDITKAPHDDIAAADIVISMIGDEAKLHKHRWGPEDEPVKIIDQQKHMLVIQEGDWALEHPIQCKGEQKGLSDCDVQKAVLLWMHSVGGVAPMPVGRYSVKLSEDGGVLIVGDRQEPVKLWGVCRHCGHIRGKHYPGITAKQLCDVDGCDCPGYIDRHDRFIVKQDPDPDPDGEEDPRATGESWMSWDTETDTAMSDWFTEADAIDDAQKLNAIERDAG